MHRTAFREQKALISVSLLLGLALPLLSACGTTGVMDSHPSLARAGDANMAKVYFLRPDIGYAGVARHAFTLSLDDKELLTLAIGDYALAYLKPMSVVVTVGSWTVRQGAQTRVRESRRLSFEAGNAYYVAFVPRVSGIETSFVPILITEAEGMGTAARTKPVGGAAQEPPLLADRNYSGSSDPPAPGKTAKVSFFRGAEALGSLCTHRILVDGQAVFALRSGERKTLHLAPGRYWFGLELEGGGFGFMCPALFTRQEEILKDGADATYQVLIPSFGDSPTLVRIEASPSKN